jgi:hypothetical protein
VPFLTLIRDEFEHLQSILYLPIVHVKHLLLQLLCLSLLSYDGSLLFVPIFLEHLMRAYR